VLCVGVCVSFRVNFSLVLSRIGKMPATCEGSCDCPDSVFHIPVSHALGHRADLVWQLEVPVMAWSGSTVRHISTQREQIFSLKDAVSGKFLREIDSVQQVGKTHSKGKKSTGGVLEFSDFDDNRRAHWKLKPLDDSTTVFEFEKTKFMLQNAETGRVIHIGRSIKLAAGSEGDLDEDGLDDSVQLPPSSISLFSVALGRARSMLCLLN
jgi:hypothetical protein